jgi:anti-sigma regulatory factor (Ser/Thr protein kinase)
VSLSVFGFGNGGESATEPAKAGPSAISGATSAFPAVGPIEEVGWFDVTDQDTAGHARRAALEVAVRLGLGQPRGVEIGEVVAELGTNLFTHARGGRLGLRCLRRAGVVGVEVIAVDAGPGAAHFPVMADFPWAAGASITGGVAAGGLGSLTRLATRYDAYSLPGRGTVITAQFWPRGVYPGVVVATGVTRPMAGEQVSGDQFAVRLRPDGALIMIADGLGHGPLAAVAASAAVTAFHLAGTDEPAELVEEVHYSIGHTRGAAIAVARLEPAEGLVRFCGLGNIAAALIAAPGTPAAARTGMVSQPGIAGHQRRNVCEFTYPISQAGLVVMHSDGVTDRWDLAAYPGLERREPLVVAATLLRDAGVRRDDACVAVAKLG